MFYSPRCVLAVLTVDRRMTCSFYLWKLQLYRCLVNNARCQLLTDTHHGITYILHAGEVANFAGYDKYKH
jgi:hypothetical protein